MARGSISRASQSLDKYLQEIGEVPLLSPQEEIELARRIKEGNQISLERLTKAKTMRDAKLAAYPRNSTDSIELKNITKSEPVMIAT